MITISNPRRHQQCNEENNPEAHRQDRHKPADQMAESPTRTGVRQEATDSMDNTRLIQGLIHATHTLHVTLESMHYTDTSLPPVSQTSNGKLLRKIMF